MENIIIKKDGNFGFDVWQGDRHSNHLGYDEMLGLVSALTMPKNRLCLHWMKTNEEWERQDSLLATVRKQPLFEGIRKCEICGCEKPISEFSKSYKHRCKACQAEVVRNKRKENKNAKN
jgi:hypothetical protein